MSVNGAILTNLSKPRLYENIQTDEKPKFTVLIWPGAFH